MNFCWVIFLIIVIMSQSVPLKTLKATIKGHKSYLTRITRQMTELLEQENPVNVTKLRGLARYLDSRLDTLDEVVSTVICHPEVTDAFIDQMAAYMTESRLFLEKSEEAYEKLETMKDAGQAKTPKTTVSPKAKLPKAPFPTFSGGPTGSRDLRIFLRMFGDLVGTHCTDSEKVTYLRLGIQGEAERLIKHIDPIPENFDLILDTL